MSNGRMHCVLHSLVEIIKELKYYTHMGRSSPGETSRVQVLHRSMAIAHRLGIACMEVLHTFITIVHILGIAQMVGNTPKSQSPCITLINGNSPQIRCYTHG